MKSLRDEILLRRVKSCGARKEGAAVNERLPLRGSSREAGERGRKKPSPSRYASHLSQRERLRLVCLGRANTVRPYDVGVLCGADFADRRGRRSPQGIASWAYFTLGSLREGAGAARRLKESACRIKQAQIPKSRRLLPPLTREPPKLGKLVSGNPAAVPLPLGGRLKLVHLGRAINDRPYTD